MKTTKAEFFRWFTPGKRVRLINCLMGPCDKPRTVSKVVGMRAELLTEDGRTSHLRIGADEHVEKTANGYRIVLTEDGRVCAEYSE